MILNEGEITIPAFIEDLEHGASKHIYTAGEWADLRYMPVTQWDLINVKNL